MLLLIDEAIEVINTEIRILNMRIKYPIQFQNRKNNFPPSPLYLTDETLFNIKLGDIHKKHDNVICRKANKRTEFLDILRKAITEESKKKSYL